MCSDPSIDWAKCETALATVVANAASLDEIAAWLGSQAGVATVQLAAHLLKSNPPQREFMLELRSGGGDPVRMLVMVAERGDGRFALQEVRAA